MQQAEFNKQLNKVQEKLGAALGEKQQLQIKFNTTRANLHHSSHTTN